MNWERAADWLDEAVSNRIVEANDLEQNYTGSTTGPEYVTMKATAQRKRIAADFAFLLSGAIRVAARAEQKLDGEKNA